MRVLLAIRTRLVADAIAASLACVAGIEVVAAATDGRDTLRLLPAARPHVVVLDASLSPLSTREMTSELDAFGGVRVVLLASGWGAVGELDEAREHIHGFVPMTEPVSLLAGTIRRVAGGERVVPDAPPSSATVYSPSGKAVRISGKQLRVLELVARGHTNAEVAAILGISARTADNHRVAVMKKLEVRRAVHLARVAIRVGLVNP